MVWPSACNYLQHASKMVGPPQMVNSTPAVDDLETETICYSIMFSLQTGSFKSGQMGFQILGSATSAILTPQSWHEQQQFHRLQQALLA